MERLEHLASIVENGGEVPVKASRVAVILNALRRFRESTRFVRQRLREAKKSPLWGFLDWSAAKRADESKDLCRHYDREISRQESNLAYIGRQLARFRKDAEKRRERPKNHSKRGRRRT
jgi:hypothetical protein